MATPHIYLMSLAASGKSTFANKYPTYQGYQVLDFASLLPKRSKWVTVLMYLLRPIPKLQNLIRKNPKLNPVGPHYYFDAVTRFMRDTGEPHIIMGRRLPPRFVTHSSFSSAKLGIVMIEENQHRAQCDSRREELRNPLPFFDHWTTDFEKVKVLRDDMLAYADQHAIPVYASFEEAAAALQGQHV